MMVATELSSRHFTVEACLAAKIEYAGNEDQVRVKMGRGTSEASNVNIPLWGPSQKRHNSGAVLGYTSWVRPSLFMLTWPTRRMPWKGEAKSVHIE